MTLHCPEKDCPIVLVSDLGTIYQQQVELALQAERLRLGHNFGRILCNVPTVRQFSILNGAFHCRWAAWQALEVTRQNGRFGPPVVVGVVDPGVGTDREAIAVETETGIRFIGPNNGLFSLALGEHGVRQSVVLSDRLRKNGHANNTFHGRDWFATAAAHASGGTTTGELGDPLSPSRLVTLSVPPGTISELDSHGNAKLERFDDTYHRLRGEALDLCVIRADAQSRRPFQARKVSTYGQVPLDQFALVPGSTFGNGSQTIDLGVNQGSAEEKLGLEIGDRIEVVQNAREGRSLSDEARHVS